MSQANASNDELTNLHAKRKDRGSDSEMYGYGFTQPPKFSKNQFLFFLTKRLINNHHTKNI